MILSTFFPLYYSLIILSFVNAIYYELMSKLLNKPHINKQTEYKYKLHLLSVSWSWRWGCWLCRSQYTDITLQLMMNHCQQTCHTSCMKYPQRVTKAVPYVLKWKMFLHPAVIIFCVK